MKPATRVVALALVAAGLGVAGTARADGVCVRILAPAETPVIRRIQD